MKKEDVDLFQTAVKLALPGLLMAASNNFPKEGASVITPAQYKMFLGMCLTLRKGVQPKLLGTFDEAVKEFDSFFQKTAQVVPEEPENKTVN